MSVASREHYEWVQQELSRDPEYLEWLDMMERESRNTRLLPNGGEITSDTSKPTEEAA